jgi:hypothetical protein
MLLKIAFLVKDFYLHVLAFTSLSDGRRKHFKLELDDGLCIQINSVLSKGYVIAKTSQPHQTSPAYASKPSLPSSPP